MDLQAIKQRFGIIGNSDLLNRAIDIARQVAPTDLAVMITGESGAGKEIFPQIIHNFSHRKHGTLIAVNCGAIPEGTIDSELFGHEKGSFTGAHDSRKGYFEVADGGTIFLDEVAELPLSTQVRLLRVLETGEFIRVGSSKVQKSNVRVVAATNVNLPKAIEEKRFREDLFYRLSSVPIYIPPLNQRKEDIYLLFRKFASDFAEKYRMPSISLTEDAKEILIEYRWPGNIRQLKNVIEQISVIESTRIIDANTLKGYLPVNEGNTLPIVYSGSEESKGTYGSERELIYKFLFDMKRDINDLKNMVYEMMTQKSNSEVNPDLQKFFDHTYTNSKSTQPIVSNHPHIKKSEYIEDTEELIEESLSLENKEVELIRKALEKHHGKRKNAADELGISERTLYRKIKEYDINI